MVKEWRSGCFILLFGSFTCYEKILYFRMSCCQHECWIRNLPMTCQCYWHPCCSLSIISACILTHCTAKPTPRDLALWRRQEKRRHSFIGSQFSLTPSLKVGGVSRREGKVHLSRMSQLARAYIISLSVWLIHVTSATPSCLRACWAIPGVWEGLHS